MGRAREGKRGRGEGEGGERATRRYNWRFMVERNGKCRESRGMGGEEKRDEGERRIRVEWSD